MSQSKITLKAIPDTALRRLRNTPSYFFLIWRWSTWLFALVWIVSNYAYYSRAQASMVILLLTITLAQTLIVTLYAPVFHILLPHLHRRKKAAPSAARKPRARKRIHPLQAPAEDDEADILTPLLATRNIYWDLIIYSVDVLICGLVTYYSGPLGNPYFGVGSPFYRYGISTALAAALTYGYRGGLAAAIGYSAFILLGAFHPAPGAPPYATPAIIDLMGGLIDAPVVAILAAYVATLLENYARSRKEIQASAREQRALSSVGETIVREASDRQRLLQKSAEQLRQGGHFQRLIVALADTSSDADDEKALRTTFETCIEANIADTHLPARDEALPEQVIQSGQRIITFEPDAGARHEQPGLARLYLPFFKDGQVQMVLGAESRRQTPFDTKQEAFLSIAGAQLLVALDNIRLTEQTIQLAAAAERSRIAREIHDGIAQLIYMLSLTTETCATQAHRIAEASEEDAELLTPLAERLDKLVAISKQALWETRNYMFSLKPLMSGATTLTQMLSNQVHEFEAISDLPVLLEVEGADEPPGEDRRRARRQAQVGAAIFRIVQEALTNAYKHAQATQIRVSLHHQADSIAVEVCDNGRGLPTTRSSANPATSEGDGRVYSGRGLGGMRERAEELDGTFEITPMPDGGTKVRAWIPIG
jgi:signal transduction histidine kinase